MQRASAIFLQAVVILIGIGALAFLIWEPQAEGVNAHATGFAEIYLDDPFLAYGYVASLSFFAALYQAFKVLGYAGHGTIFSAAAMKALRTLKRCALAMIGFVAGGEILILLQPSDDRAGGVVMGLLIAFSALTMAAIATILERNLQTALDAAAETQARPGTHISASAT